MAHPTHASHPKRILSRALLPDIRLLKSFRLRTRSTFETAGMKRQTSGVLIGRTGRCSRIGSQIASPRSVDLRMTVSLQRPRSLSFAASQAGVDARPTNNFDMRLSGNFLQTTGVGEISGELPVYGTIRWPVVTGTIGYRFPRIGRLSAELMRTYFIQDIFSADNFSGNVLAIRLTKEF